MSSHRPLRGSCSCGRNNYIIALPANAVDSAHVYFDGSSSRRRTQAAPFTAWLHIPLTWFQSHTTSYYPDETHSMIRKSFTPPREPRCKRNFCGYCGTHLTHWSEDPKDEADYLNVTLGSIFGEDLRTLEDLGLLPNDDTADDALETSPWTEVTQKGDASEAAGHAENSRRMIRHGADGNVMWTEEVIDGRRSGMSHKTKRGRGQNLGGTTMVEWEITELIDDGSEAESGSGRGKRKLGADSPTGDSQMDG